VVRASFFIVFHIRSRGGKNIGNLLEKASFSDFSQFSMNRISSNFQRLFKIKSPLWCRSPCVLRYNLHV